MKRNTSSAPTWSSANLSSAAVGSDPGDNTKMSGAQQLESANAFPRSNGGGSINRLPSLTVTKSWTAGVICQEDKAPLTSSKQSSLGQETKLQATGKLSKPIGWANCSTKIWCDQCGNCVLAISNSFSLPTQSLYHIKKFHARKPIDKFKPHTPCLVADTAKSPFFETGQVSRSSLQAMPRSEAPENMIYNIWLVKQNKNEKGVSHRVNHHVDFTSTLGL